MSSTTPAAAYRALSHAAERMAANNFAKLPDKTRAAMAKGRVPRNTPWPSQAHRDVMVAMLDVMNGRMTPHEAMSLLWSYDVEHERWPAA